MKDAPSKTAPTTEELQAILDSPNPGKIFNCGEYGLVPELRLTELQAHLGNWMDSVRCGRQYAVTRKGELIALLLPPPQLSTIFAPKEQKPETKTVTVCSECLCASCWKGELMCSESRDAGTVEKTVEELEELGFESPHYWE